MKNTIRYDLPGFQVDISRLVGLSIGKAAGGIVSTVRQHQEGYGATMVYGASMVYGAARVRDSAETYPVSTNKINLWASVTEGDKGHYTIELGPKFPSGFKLTQEALDTALLTLIAEAYKAQIITAIGRRSK
jgi:hypothetical protein